MLAKLRWPLVLVALFVFAIIERFVRSPALAIIAVVAFGFLYAAGLIWVALRDADRSAPVSKNVTTVKPAVAGTLADSSVEALEAKLGDLDRARASGLLDEAEYEAKRAQLIADF
jgi:multidrug resistance efflux pump